MRHISYHAGKFSFVKVALCALLLGALFAAPAYAGWIKAGEPAPTGNSNTNRGGGQTVPSNRHPGSTGPSGERVPTGGGGLPTTPGTGGGLPYYPPMDMSKIPGCTSGSCDITTEMLEACKNEETAEAVLKASQNAAVRNDNMIRRIHQETAMPRNIEGCIDSLVKKVSVLYATLASVSASANGVGSMIGSAVGMAVAAALDQVIAKLVDYTCSQAEILSNNIDNLICLPSLGSFGFDLNLPSLPLLQCEGNSIPWTDVLYSLSGENMEGSINSYFRNQTSISLSY